MVIHRLRMRMIHSVMNEPKKKKMASRRKFRLKSMRILPESMKLPLSHAEGRAQAPRRSRNRAGTRTGRQFWLMNASV